MELSRLSVTGALTANTPICVLYEIIHSHGYDYPSEWISSHYLQALQLCQNTFCAISNPIKSDEYRIIARFVNYDRTIEWDTKTLSMALTYLMNYNQNPIIPIKPIMGQQSPTNIESLNACMLYCLCTKNKILLCHNTTPQQMFYAISFSQQSKDILVQKLLTADNSTLASLITLEQTECLSPANRSLVDSKTLEIEHRELNKVSSVRKRLFPRDNLEAIALGALNYMHDLTYSSNPLLDYLRLNANTPTFRVFNPIFPLCYYTITNLETLLQHEGSISTDRKAETMYNKLKEIVLLNTFYSMTDLEARTPAIKYTAIYHTELSTLPSSTIVFYGCLVDNTFVAYTLEELAQHFLHALAFIDPLTKDPLFTHSIRKLRRLCTIANSFGEKCIAAMRETELHNTKVSGRANEFLQQYRTANPIKRAQIDDILNTLLNLTMYMRGWDGESKELPIAVAINKDTVRTDIKVHESIAAFRKKCAEVGNIGQIILQLPLFCYRNGDYRASADVEDGLTLDDRLNIICDKDRASKPKACIRLSSNWLAASVHRYIILLAKAEPFDIKLLANIS